jgi:hypothetical protein
VILPTGKSTKEMDGRDIEFLSIHQFFKHTNLFGSH